MKVLDQEPWAWTLFEKDNSYFLDANCNHSAFGYSFMIELNEAEMSEFKKIGRNYLNKLAYDIHYSAPIHKDSKSIYKGRDVAAKYTEECSKAFQEWRNLSAK